MAFGQRYGGSGGGGGNYRGQNRAPCKFWAQGNCIKGNACSFSHDAPKGGARQQNFSNAPAASSGWGATANPFSLPQPPSLTNTANTSNPFATQSQPSSQQSSSFNSFGGGGFNAFGANPSTSSAFGQQSNPFATSSTPAFGTSSGFGQTITNTANPFATGGATSSPFASNTNNPFAASNPTASNPFATSMPVNSPFANNAAPSNPFATPNSAAASNPFAASQAPASNPFASTPLTQTSNPFAALSTTPANPFASTQPQHPANPFATATPSQPGNPFSGGSVTSSNPFSTGSSPFNTGFGQTSLTLNQPQQLQQQQSSFGLTQQQPSQPGTRPAVSYPLKCKHKSLQECAEHFKQDMQQVTYPFTCHGHHDECPVSIIGDLSYEEQRWALMKADSEGTAQTVINQLNQRRDFMLNVRKYYEQHPELLHRDVSGLTFEQFEQLIQTGQMPAQSQLQTQQSVTMQAQPTPTAASMAMAGAPGGPPEPTPFPSAFAPSPTPGANPFQYNAPAAGTSPITVIHEPSTMHPAAAQPPGSNASTSLSTGLSAADIEAQWRAPAFQFGRIPECAPPEGLL